MLDSIITAATILAVFANITVPVVPDPEYIRSLDLPAVQAPNNNNGNVIPTDLGQYVPYIISGVTTYLIKREHDKNEKRQGAAAETIVKLAENDESTDKGTLDIIYADRVLVDILCQDPVMKQRFDEYKTEFGTNATQFFEDMSRNFNQDFESYYKKTKIIPTTKDPVVNTLKKVQDKVTPS